MRVKKNVKFTSWKEHGREDNPNAHAPTPAPLHMRSAPGRVGRVTLARRAAQALNMAPPSPAAPKAPSPSSAAKSEEEMVLPGFPDADSFVKVSPRGLGRGAGERREPPRPVAGRPGPSRRPPSGRAHLRGAGRRAQSLPKPSGMGSHAGHRGSPRFPEPSFSQESPPHRGEGFLSPRCPSPRDLAPPPPVPPGCLVFPTPAGAPSCPGMAPLPSPGLQSYTIPKPGPAVTCYSGPRAFLSGDHGTWASAFWKEHRVHLHHCAVLLS